MRANGARLLSVSCVICHRKALLAVGAWPDHVPVPALGPRMVCTSCEMIGADARPNRARGRRGSLTGVRRR